MYKKKEEEDEDITIFVFGGLLRFQIQKRDMNFWLIPVQRNL